MRVVTLPKDQVTLQKRDVWITAHLVVALSIFCTITTAATSSAKEVSLEEDVNRQPNMRHERRVPVEFFSILDNDGI